MNCVFILSYNNLDISFWEQHLDLDKVESIYIFRQGSTCLNNLKLKPDMLIIDEYFAPKDSGALSAQDITLQVLDKRPETSIINLSPKHFTNCSRDTLYPHYRSNFNSEIIEVMNQLIQHTTPTAA